MLSLRRARLPAPRPLDPERLLPAIEALYASALDSAPDNWKSIFSHCASLLEAGAGGFAAAGKDDGPTDFAGVVGFDPARALAIYEQHGTGVDLVRTESAALPAGTTFLSDERIGRARMHASVVHQELALPSGMDTCLVAVLENDAHQHSALGFWRPMDARPFDGTDRKLLDVLLPHVRQAVRVQRRLRDTGGATAPARASLTLEGIDGSRHGIFILDDQGVVLFANRVGEQLLRAGDGLVVRAGVLGAAEPGTQAALQGLLARARLDLPAAARPGPLRIRRSGMELPYELLVMPVRELRESGSMPPRSACIVAVSDPAMLGAASPDRLRAYGLTGAEIRLCQALLRTGSLGEAAEDLHISESTARTHLKHVFAKLGVSSQIQLVTTLVAGYAG